jgi:hypothetical protein
MTVENVAAFSPTKPPIVEILLEGLISDQSESDMMRRIAEHYPEATLNEIAAERDYAVNYLAWLQVGDKPTVPVDWLVERILNRALDDVDARWSNKPATSQSVVKDAVGLIAQHPAQQSIILSLAMQQLKLILDEVADERGIDLSDKFIERPAVVEATEEEWSCVPPENAWEN